MKFSQLIKSSYTKTYIGNADYEGVEDWGNYLYVQIVSELLDAILLERLRNHPQYVTEIDEKEFVFFVFEFTMNQKIKVVSPFINGKYSEIDREYVRENFPMYINGKVSMNWRILNKDVWQIPHDVVPLRQYWLARIGCPIPEEGEVWPKPKKEEEIYNYYDEILKREVANSKALSY